MKYRTDFIALLSIALSFLIIGDTIRIVEQQAREVEITPPYFEKILPLPSEKEEVIEEENHAEFEESPTDISFLFYATEPIGRYYITAYNHKETGSKITASGKTVHQGTITTCAADVWGGYFKFGDYLEITVNGEPKLFVVEDTGSAVKRKHIDIYFESYSAMARYGSNYQSISRVTFPFGVPKYD